MLPSVETFTVLSGRNATDVAKSSNALLQYTFSQTLRRCPCIKNLLIPSCLLSPTTTVDLSTLTKLRSLVLLESLTLNEHRILSAAQLSPESFLLLRKLEFTTDTLEVALCLWNTPLIAHVTHVVLIVDDIKADNTDTLFKLVVCQSPGLDSLSISYPFTSFQLFLFDILAPLKLRKLALGELLYVPQETHSNVLDHIETLWPDLEYLSIPFEVEFDDLLRIPVYLPHLRHLAIDFPFDDIELLTLPTEALWKSVPKHELVLWIQSIADDAFEHEWMEGTNNVHNLTQVLALIWPNIRLFIRGETKYYEHPRRDVAVCSYDIFQSDAPIDNLDDADGLIATNSMWAYIEEASLETQIYSHTFL